MVLLHVKREQRSLFLLEKKLDDKVKDVLADVVRIHNGRLRVHQICDELDSLAQHGVYRPPEQQGLLEEQLQELKLTEVSEPEPEGGPDPEEATDPLQRRTGRRPGKEARELLEAAARGVRQRLEAEARIKEKRPLDWAEVQTCLDILSGAVGQAYTGGLDALPEYEPVRLALEDKEDLSGTAASKEVLSADDSTLWFANKELDPGAALSARLGRHEKTTAVVKVSTQRQGRPAAESSLSPATQKRLMQENYRRMEELRRLERDDSDDHLSSGWADGQSLKRRFQGLDDITWK